MSPEAHARLVELDALSREGREFYDYAAALLPPSALRERCLRLGRAKAELVAVLAQRLRDGRPARHDRRAGPPRLERAQLGYRQARAGLAAQDAGRLRRELERVETATAEACQAQAAGSGDADCRRVMAWALPMLQRCRDEIAPAADAAYSV